MALRLKGAVGAFRNARLGGRGLGTVGLYPYVEEDQEAQGAHAPLQGQSRQASQYGPRLIVAFRTFYMNEPNAQLTGLTIQADREQWQVCGLVPPDSDDDPLIGGVRFVFLGTDGNDSMNPGAGLISWSIDGLVASGDIDGIPTNSVAHGGGTESESPLGITGIDHIVINTDNLERTSDAIARATGCELRRIREVNDDMRQGFHRLGSVIVEIVERTGAPAGASLWGVVFNVADIDRACEWLGPDVVSPPKDAVQEGRRIATVRAIAGLGAPVALMSV